MSRLKVNLGFVRHIDVTALQGFYFSKPVADELTGMLDRPSANLVA